MIADIHHLHAPSVQVSDREAVRQQPINITLRAMRGCAIVWFMPYRREGLIEIPDKHKEQSAEALIIDDNTGYGLRAGTKVLVSRLKGDGEYFEVNERRLCRVKREGLYLIDESNLAA